MSQKMFLVYIKTISDFMGAKGSGWILYINDQAKDFFNEGTVGKKAIPEQYRELPGAKMNHIIVSYKEYAIARRLSKWERVGGISG